MRRTTDGCVLRSVSPREDLRGDETGTFAADGSSIVLLVLSR